MGGQPRPLRATALGSSGRDGRMAPPGAELENMSPPNGGLEEDVARAQYFCLRTCWVHYFEQKWVPFDERRGKRPLLLESCRKQGFEPRTVYRCEREDWIQMMVAAGRGVTLMPENLHLGHGTSARQLVEPALNREVSLVTVAGRPHAPSVQHFIRAICAHRWDDASSRANDSQYRRRLSSKIVSSRCRRQENSSGR
jgi:hypothetical protein